MRDSRANVIVARALKTGELIAPERCEVCGRKPNPLRERIKRTIWAHHDDYSKPLIVRWLCPSCHRKWHIRHQPAPGLDAVRVPRLTIEQLEEIRYLIGIGLSDAFIAKEIGCGKTTIWRIRRARI
jgi:hypothetical protein